MATQPDDSGQKASISRARPRFYAPNTDFATIFIGPENQRFVVHESLLTHYSNFFRAALNGGFKEAEDKCVTLSEEDPVVFESFVYWLYHKGFPTEIRDQHGELIEFWLDKNDCVGVDLFVHLYILGDKYSIKELCRDAMDAAFNNINDEADSPLPVSSTIRKAFDCLGPESPICRLIVRGYSCWTSVETFREFGMCDYLPFAQEMLSYLLEQIRERKPPCIRLCDFHEHTTDAQRRACEGKDRYWTWL